MTVNLQQLGFELLDDNRKQLIEKIKSIVIEHIHYNDDEKFKFLLCGSGDRFEGKNFQGGSIIFNQML